MLPISILEKTDHSIVYEILAGKPNPSQKCSLAEDTQDRVYQEAFKGNTCWYYTLNFIRKRIGKVPSDELLKEREIEKLCSVRRKAQTAHENSLPAIAEQLESEIGMRNLKGIDIEKAKWYIKNKAIIQPILETPETLDGAPSLFPFIEEFLREGKCKNMHEFLYNKKIVKRNEINIEFLSKFNINPEKLFAAEITPENGYPLMSWDTLTDDKKAPHFDYFVRDESATVYGLHRSSWSPSQGVDGLIDELKKNGPLYVGGVLGKSIYMDDPFKMSQKLADRDIYAWRPGTNRRPTIFFGHSVLLVGAKKVQDKAYVYFIDSKDPSDPKDRSLQKIYMISFANLTSNICDLQGALRPVYPVPYAYYGNFKL